MVFQHYALFPHMSVLENVAFGLEARGVAKAERLRRAEVALDGVGLQGKGNRRVQQLSGGEQQRVALARAVLIQPKVLLLDEPLSNLDPTLRHSTRDELRAMLRRVDAPALFVTHDQEDAFAVADRIVLLAKGRVLQIGTPEDLYVHPASRDVAAFIGRATLVAAQDNGTSATVTLGGVSRMLDVTRPFGEDRPFSDALVVLRAEALSLTGPESQDTWPGVIVGRRFTGATTAYHVRLSDVVTVEVQSTRRMSEGERVGISSASGAVPIVSV
jgi:ABC-type Fe3+/spermidine/putrescine transport system ATPase subunit